MYKVFNLSSVNLNAIEKRIDLKFNFDIDPNSISADTLSLVSLDGIHSIFTYKVVDDVITMTLKEWPEPNSVYQILLNKELKSISGQNLKNAIRYRLTFSNEVTSEVTIVEPYNFQKLDNLVFKFKDSENIGQYYIEIAKENRFYNLVYDAIINTNEIELFDQNIAPGQYYIRARVKTNKEFGKWCSPVTFIYKEICDCEEQKPDGPSANASMPSAWSDLFGNGLVYDTVPKNILDSIQPEVEEDLEVLTYPEQGVTPESFIFEFDKNLDVNFGEVIIIKREF